MRRIYKAEDIWFTADFHIGHRAVIYMCGRPYEDMGFMIEDIIEKWNAKVKPHHTVFILGDLSYKSSKRQVTAFLSRLNGIKVLIKGNHDNMKRTPTEMFDWIERIETIEIIDGDKKKEVELCHYPLLSWANMRRGRISLFGHSHSKMPAEKLSPNQMDVGWDVKYDLFSWEDIKKALNKE